MHKTDTYVIYFILTLFIGLIPLLWFKGYPIAGEEYYALDYAQWGHLFSGSWFNAVNWGEYSPLSSFKFQGLFFNFLYILRVSKYIALILWYTGISVLTAGSMYRFLFMLFHRKYPAFLYFLGSCYYLMSPFFLNISVTLSPPKLFFLVLPIIFTLFLGWLSKKNINFVDIAGINLILMLFSPIFVNIPLGAVLVAVVFLNLLVASLILKINWRKTILMLTVFTLVYLVLNIWWFLPTALKQFSQSVNVRQEAASFATVDKTSTFDALSLFGSWAFREKIYNTDYSYFPFNKAYDTFPGGVIRFIPYVFMLYALFAFYKTNLASKKEDRDYIILYLIFVHLIFLFLAKGTSEPFSFIYKALYEKFPLFWIYREPYAKFAPIGAFTMPIFLIYGAGSFYNQYAKRFPLYYFKIAAGISLLFFYFYAQPFINGSIIWDVNYYTTRSYHVKIPNQWVDMQNQWHPDSGYYYQFPSTDLFNSYNWESGYNGNPYLMFTNAKLLNPESGYSASENQERKYITSYLYNLIINSPAELIKNASRYYMSGIILQKDTVYNNYKYAFNVIQKHYSELLSYSNDIAGIYKLTQTPSLVDITSKSTLIKLKSEALPYYHLIREVTDSDVLMEINEETSAYAGITPLAGKDNYEVSYNLSLRTPGFNYYLYGNLDNIQNIRLDDKNISTPESSENFIKISPDKFESCCKNIVIRTKGGLLSGGSAPLLWGALPKLAPDIKQYQPLNSQNLQINTEQVYIAPLPFFDPSKVNHIQISLRGNYNYPVGMSLVQVASDSKSTRYFANYKVQDISKPLTIVYDGVVNSLTNIFENSNYYIAIYGMQLTDAEQKIVPYPADISYTAGPVTVIQERIPYVFALPNLNRPAILPSVPEYKQISNSITLLKAPADLKEPAVLQFKNSFNLFWKLIPIDAETYDKIDKNGIGFSDLLMFYSKRDLGKTPINIEYYSNGWELNESDAGSHLAIVFIPNLIQSISFYISMSVAGLLVIYLVKMLFKVRLSK